MNKAPKEEILAAVLCGGRSRRIGKNKAFLELAGKPLVKWVIERLVPIFPKVVLIGPDELKQFGLEVFKDIKGPRSPLTGIYTALCYLKTPLFICGCDMPFLKEPLIKFEVEEMRKGFDIVVPKSYGNFEPLCAVYSLASLEFIPALLEKKGARIIELFQNLKVREILDEELDDLDKDRISFFNINTTEDLKEAERLIREKTDYTS